MGVNLPGLERDSPSFFVGLGRDDIFFVGVWRERFENPLPCHPLVQWFSTFFPPGRTMVQVQVSRAARKSFTYYVINTNQPGL